MAKNGYTPLHTSAKKNQIDIAKTLLDYEAKVDAEYSFLHLASQEGHHETAGLLISQGATINAKAKNKLTPIHLCPQVLPDIEFVHSDLVTITNFCPIFGPLIRSKAFNQARKELNPLSLMGLDEQLGFKS